MLWWIAAGCDWFDDPIVAQALDYVAAEPRVLAVRADPPWFVSGTEVTFDALVFGPDGPGGSAMLSVCGLDPEVRADISDVSCFADRSRVTELGEVPGLAWTPPALSFDCEEGDTVEFGGACSTRVVMLATPDTDGRLASFGASIGADAAAVGKPLVALADSPPVIELEATEVDGAVLLTTTVDAGRARGARRCRARARPSIPTRSPSAGPSRAARSTRPAARSSTRPTGPPSRP